VVESFFARFGEGRDPFLEAKSLGSRLPSGPGYRTPKEVMEEALGQSTQDVTGRVKSYV